LNKHILNTVVQDFIKSYSGEISKLAFAGSPFAKVSVQELIQQIEGRQKIEKKLPNWFHTKGVYYPPKIHLEQTSSEATAKYKASLVHGDKLADLTGGFGVDAYYFSEVFNSVLHFEQNQSLSEIAAHNFDRLSKNNIQCLAVDGIVTGLQQHYDILYIDPSRRHSAKGKVFYLRDCEPNVPVHLGDLLDHCITLMIKTSPMLDITIGMQELNTVAQLHIVAVNNEVKELLWIVKKDYRGTTHIRTVNITNSGNEVFNFTMDYRATATYAPPQHFLYEPNSAIMKSGAFDLVSEEFSIHKLHKHSHLYTSDTLCEFPGRRFTIEKIIPYTKASIREELSISKANITIRNFPESVAQLRKKWGVKEGGDDYLFFTTLENEEKVIIHCSRVQ
jgi:hypothetical protein